MQSPYAKRRINLTFQLGQGSFGNSGYNTVKLTNLRILVNLTLATLPSQGILSMRVWGMTLDQMNQLSQAGLQYAQRGNSVLVEAGDDQSGYAAVFNGGIREAYPSFDPPDSAFVVNAYGTDAQVQLKPIPGTSTNSASDGATILKSICAQVGLTLENNGVQVILPISYFWGTAWQQISQCIRAMDCACALDSVNHILAIWPKNSGRQTAQVPIISKNTGMINYPDFMQNRVIVRTLFDPSIKFGGTMQIQSQFTAANGNWLITEIDYTLASRLPNGPWEMRITGAPATSNVG